MNATQNAHAMTNYSVYIVQCADGTLYTGIAKDLQTRIEHHNSGTGAKYTRMRRPVKLVFNQTCDSHSAALKREYAIKQLSRKQKLALISSVESTLS